MATTLQSSPTNTLEESRKIQDFLRTEAQLNNISEDHAVQILNKRYGSVKAGMKVLEAARAEREAIMARGFAPGSEPIEIGRKPKQGEEVNFVKLHADLWIRIWPGDLDHCFCFDFVDAKGQYMRTPSGIRIYAVPIGGSPGGRVLSIEASFEAHRDNSPEFARSFHGMRDESKVNSDWETYVIMEGVRLRIEQDTQPDRFLNIPVRTPQGANLVLQPWQ